MDDAGLWDAPAEHTLARYLETIEAGPGRDATRALLLAALRTEPMARGCPTLAMITPLDLLGLRAHLEVAGAPDVEGVLDAIEAFLSWARKAGAHALPPHVVTLSLRPPDL